MPIHSGDTTTSLFVCPADQMMSFFVYCHNGIREYHSDLYESYRIETWETRQLDTWKFKKCRILILMLGGVNMPQA